jgi:hypothetical protein
MTSKRAPNAIAVAVLLTAALHCRREDPVTRDAAAGMDLAAGGGGGASGADTGPSGSGDGSATAGSGGGSPIADGPARPASDGPIDTGAGPAPRDAAKADQAVASPGRDAGSNAGAALDDYVFSVPCPAATTAGQCDVPDAARLKTSEPLRFGGDPGVTYRVLLHFCGPVEGRKYAGCKPSMAGSDPLLCMDGTPVGATAADQAVDTYPTYEMKVSAPAHSYFVNSRDLRDTLMKIDYSAEVEIQGGSTIVFATTSREPNTYTARKVAPPITCPGVPGLVQPFAGQFIHVTVQSVSPR